MSRVCTLYFLINKYGIIGAAVATLITKFVLVFSLSKTYKRFVNINYANNLMLYLPGFFFVLSLLVFYEFGNIFTLIKITVFMIILIISFFYFKKDLDLVRNSIKKND